MPKATLNGVQKEITNCRQVTVADRQVWIPKDNYYLPPGESCETNRLSRVVVSGKRPACNGYVMRGRYNTSSFISSGYGQAGVGTGSLGATASSPVMGQHMQIENYHVSYNQYNDQRKQLADARNNSVRSQVNSARSKVSEALRINGTSNVSCETAVLESLPAPETTAVAARMVPVHDELRDAPLQTLGLSAQQEQFKYAQVALSVAKAFMDQNSQVAQSGGGASEALISDPSVGLTNATKMLNRYSGISRKNGYQQYFSGQVSQYLPYGLWSAFASEPTDWMEPPTDIQSSLMSKLKSLTNSTPIWAACSTSSLVNAIAGADVINLSYLRKVLGCIGSWGMDTEVGWAYNSHKPVAGALVGARGHGVALKLGTVQANLRGTQQFNLDYPPLYNESPYAQGIGFGASAGKHKGSGCYDVGTTHTGWYNIAERGAPAEIFAKINPLQYLPDPGGALKGNKNLEADMDAGQYSSTYWKRTSCTVKFDVSGMNIASSVATGSFPGTCYFKQQY